MEKSRPAVLEPRAITLGTADLSQMSPNERLKAQSEGLFWVGGEAGHSFASEIDAMTRGGSSDTLSNDAKEISKYFGIYAQQERLEGRKTGESIFMVRVKAPAGGEFSPAQWAALDEATEQFADGTIRLTSRQGLQFHHVTAKDLGPLIRHLNQDYDPRDATLTTLGACGDVNRNTMCSPIDDLHQDCPLRSRELAFAIAAELAPRAGASSYYQVFLQDDEAERMRPVISEEPIYGRHYLPRKFKVGIAHPLDNSIDVLTQDVGFVPVVDESGSAKHYELYSGGGLGITHNMPKTQQLLALYLGRVPHDHVVQTATAIAILQKENGERKDRKQARWKYTIRRLGAEWVRAELRNRFRIDLSDGVPQPLPPNRFWLGWHPEVGEADRYFLGLHVLSGRLKDEGAVHQRSAVRTLVSELALGVRITPNQDLLLCHVPGDKRMWAERQLEGQGVALSDSVSTVRQQALACPAKPTCGLAMTDAERALPRYLEAIEQAGLGGVDVVIRVAGCPNSCSRPPTAEIGVIGYGKNDHLILVGGSREGTHIAKPLYSRVPEHDMASVLVSLLRTIVEHGGDQRAGEFLRRTPVDQLRVWVGYDEPER